MAEKSTLCTLHGLHGLTLIWLHILGKGVLSREVPVGL